MLRTDLMEIYTRNEWETSENQTRNEWETSENHTRNEWRKLPLTHLYPIALVPSFTVRSAFSPTALYNISCHLLSLTLMSYSDFSGMSSKTSDFKRRRRNGRRSRCKLHTRIRVEKMWKYTRNEWRRCENTLETSGEDVKIHSNSSGEDMKIHSNSSGEDITYSILPIPPPVLVSVAVLLYQ